MELKDTVKLMLSADFKERFQAEYHQDKKRAEGLAKMLKAYKAGTLPFKPKCSYELLYEQLIYMRAKLKVLEERAEIEGIDLAVINGESNRYFCLARMDRLAGSKRRWD